MKLKLRRIPEVGSNLGLGLIIGLMIGAIGVALARALVPSLHPGDAAVIVAVPCMIGFVMMRLMAAVLASTNLPPDSGDEPKATPVFMAIVVACAVTMPLLVLIVLSGVVYRSVGLPMVSVGALKLAKLVFYLLVASSYVIALRAVYLHWSGTFKKVYTAIVETPKDVANNVHSGWLSVRQ